MRLFSVAVLALSFASTASAGNISFGSSEVGTLYELKVSPLVDLGNGLISVIISIENISGNPNFNVNSITHTQFGTASGLHHDFGGGGFVSTPLGRTSIDLFGIGSSTVDSHFLPDGQVASPIISSATETGPLTNLGAPTQFAAVSGATGLGSGISGEFGFASGQTVNLAQLVFPVGFVGAGVDYALRVADADPASEGESFSGFIGVFPKLTDNSPEPTTLVLVGMTFVGLVVRRPQND